MAVLTAPYCGSNLVHLPTMKLSCRTICPVCIAGCHKKLCFGSNQASLLGLQSKPRKLELRAGRGRGFEGSDDEDENNENGDEAEENVSFWERQDTRQKMKELEEMRDLIEEAEKLQDRITKAEAEEEEEEESAKEKESEEEKREKLREELAKRAKEQAAKRKAAEVMFQMGQRAYGKGMYNKAVELLEGALSNVAAVSLVGGEIQLWLAMAYEAHNRHDDCIKLYKILEKTHPIKAIRQKAADLRYIHEAPRLKITEDEMVTIPLIDYDLNYRSSKKSWSQMYRNRRKATGTKQPSPSRDYFQDFLVWKRPKWERSPLFWVVVAVWLTVVGVALVFQD